MDRPCCPFDWSSIMVATCADGNPECYFCVNRPTKSKKQRAKPGQPIKILCQGQQSIQNGPVACTSYTTEVATRATAELNQILVGLSQINAIEALSQAAEQANLSQQLVAEEFDKSRRLGKVTDSGTVAFKRSRGHQLKVKTNTTVSSLLQVKTKVYVPVSITASAQVLGATGDKAMDRIIEVFKGFFSSSGLNIHFPSNQQRRADKRYFDNQYIEFVLKFPSDDEDLDFENCDLEVIEVDDKKSTGHVTLAKDPLNLIYTHLYCNSGVELKLSIDGGGGTLKCMATLPNVDYSHYAHGGSPCLLVLAEISETRNTVGFLLDRLAHCLVEFLILISADTKLCQIIAGCSVVGCVYCVSKGNRVNNRQVYSALECDIMDERTSERADTLSMTHGQKYPPLLRFGGSPHRYFLPPLLHIGMALIKQVLKPYCQTWEKRKLCQAFIYRQYKQTARLPTSKSTLQITNELGYTGKATNAICAKCLEDGKSAEAIWGELGVDCKVPGIEHVTVQFLCNWAKIRDICYAKPPLWNWIEELQDTIDEMRLTWFKNRYPVVLLIHVLFSHLTMCAKYHLEGFGA